MNALPPRLLVPLGMLLGMAALPPSTRSCLPQTRAKVQDQGRAAGGSGGTQATDPSLYQQGRQALREGRLDAAERLWQRGQKQAKAAGDLREEAKCSFGRGYLADELHAFDQAVLFYLAAMSLWEQVGDRTQFALSEENLALDYYTLGQIDAARIYLQDALAIRRKLQDADYVAIDLYRIGGIYEELGQPDQAIESWQQARTHHWKQDDQVLPAQCLNNLGLIYRETDQLKEALGALQSAAAIRQKIGSALAYADTLNNLGQVYDDLGQPDQALPNYRQALQLFEDAGQKVDITSGSSSLARDLGSLYLRLGQEEKAEKAFQQALQQEETLRAQIVDPGEVTDLQAALPNAYAGLAALRLRQKRLPEALELVERGRVQGLARQTAQCRAEFSGLLPAADRTRLQTARQALSDADRQQRIAARRPASPGTDPQSGQARDRYQQAKTALTQLHAELCRRVPDYGRFEGMNPPSLAQMQALADRNPDTLYLEWTVVDSGTTLLFALSHSGLHAFTLPVGSRELARRTRQWREALIAPGETRLDRQTQAQRLAATEPALARTLTALLFGPLEKAGLMPFGKKVPQKRLMIVADGPLLDIPFAALIDSSGRRLTTRMALATSPSIGMLDWPAAVSSSRSTTLLCVADPTGKEGQVLRSGSRGKFGALPYARKEGEAVARLFPHALTLFGPEARKVRVAQEIGRYTLLHFATHGVLDTRVGLRSGLALAPDTAGSSEAAILDAREILGLKLSARLAVLSACESGLGQQTGGIEQRTGGEGLKGLCWAFRAAGCPSIVAAQWKVDDVATRDLMIAFYSGLKAGKRKDDALREAMLLGAAAPNHTRPFYWAAFQVMGDTLPLPTAP